MKVFFAALSSVAVCAAAGAATVPFTESFAVGSASWRDNGAVSEATWAPSGGPDGSAHVSTATNVNAAVFGALTVFRGHSAFGSSGGAFVGNWIGEGVTQFSFDVRHNASMPLSFGTRFAAPANSPGASAVDFTPIAPGVWSTVTIPINPANPQFVSFGGSDFATIFSSIGNIQLILSVPGALQGSGAVITVDADNIRIVPGPAPAVLALAAAIGLMRRRR